MFRYVLMPFRFAGGHRWITLAGVVLLCLAAFAGANLWAWHHFRAAEQALRDDDMEQARRHIAQCLRVWRRGGSTQLLAARIERVSGHYPEAEQHLSECVRLQHGASEATQLEEVLLRAQAGELHEVEEGLIRCIEADHPQSAAILETLARVYMRDLCMKHAQFCLTMWLEREPSMARAWHWRGWVREQLHLPERAIPDYQQALELEPGRWGVRLRLTNLFLERNNSREAEPHLEVLLRDHGEDEAVLVAQARYHRLQGEEKQAIQLLDQLLASHPDSVDALTLRGQLAKEQGHPAEAEVFLRRALRLRPAEIRTQFLYYQCLEQEGKAAEAAKALARFQKVEADGFRLSEILNHELERAPTSADLLSEIGALCLRLDEEDSGVRWLYRALKENENHQKSHEILLKYYESKGDESHAAKHRERLTLLNGGVPPSSTNKN